MGILTSGLTAFGRLIMLVVLLIAFLGGMAGVVYMSLSGAEMTVPDLVGKDFVESERELAALGLKVKKRAERPSDEKINTVLEQLPKAGETVKTGQMILVVVSRSGGDGAAKPKSLIKDIESDDTEKIEEMISDRPKRTRANTNANANMEQKKADTTRDVIANISASPADTGAPDGGAAKKDEPVKKESDQAPGSGERPPGTTATPRPQSSPPANRPPPPTTGSGEQRPRTTPRP
jgi:beta-lactam-binding protein with PASTA domain